MSIKKLQLCFDKLIGFLGKVTLRPSEDMLLNLTHRQVKILLAGQDACYWHYLKKRSPNTYKKERAEYNRLLKLCTDNDGRIQGLIIDLTRKLDKLINS